MYVVKSQSWVWARALAEDHLKPSVVSLTALLDGTCYAAKAICAPACTAESGAVQGCAPDQAPAARSGLPPALVALKAGLEAAHAGLPRENPGSRWPKATLGMLGDARRLLPDQLARLNALCACAPPPASCVRGQG